MDDFGPGAICTVNRGTADYRLFSWAVTAHLPQGTFPSGCHSSGDLAHARNLTVENALAIRTAEWVAFLDTDQVPEGPQTILRLLRHRVDVVGATIVQRAMPFEVAAYTDLETARRVRLKGLPLGLVPLPKGGVGTGCLLVQRSVLEKLGAPWFACGQINPTRLQEDIFFMRRLLEAGYVPHLDGSLRIGHAGGCTVWPGDDGRVWIQFDGPEDVRIPLDLKYTEEED